MDPQEFWTDGKNGDPVCIVVDDRGRLVLADTEKDGITQRKFESAIKGWFPDVEFRVWEQAGFWMATGRREGTL